MPKRYLVVYQLNLTVPLSEIGVRSLGWVRCRSSVQCASSPHFNGRVTEIDFRVFPLDVRYFITRFGVHHACAAPLTPLSSMSVVSCVFPSTLQLGCVWLEFQRPGSACPFQDPDRCRVCGNHGSSQHRATQPSIRLHHRETSEQHFSSYMDPSPLATSSHAWPQHQGGARAALVMAGTISPTRHRQPAALPDGAAAKNERFLALTCTYSNHSMRLQLSGLCRSYQLC